MCRDQGIFKYVHGLPKWLSGKESACQFGRHKRCRFSPWAGKKPGEGNSELLPCSRLGNPMDRGVCQEVPKNGIPLNTAQHMLR